MIEWRLAARWEESTLVLLWLTDYLSQFVSGFSVFQYLTFRTMVSVMTALLISLVIGPLVIDRLARLQIGQTVRDDGPQSHLSKAGTPYHGRRAHSHRHSFYYACCGVISRRTMCGSCWASPWLSA